MEICWDDMLTNDKKESVSKKAPENISALFLFQPSLLQSLQKWKRSILSLPKKDAFRIAGQIKPSRWVNWKQLT